MTHHAMANDIWHQRGVGGGGALYVPSISPHNSEVYMSTDMSAVYHSKDMGSTWKMTHFSELTGSTQSKVVFTKDPKILYALNEGLDARPPFYALKKSTDGGKTWQPIDILPNEEYDKAYDFFVSPTDLNLLAVVTKSDILLSINGGESFRKINRKPLNEQWAIAGALWMDNFLYVSVADGFYFIDIFKNNSEMKEISTTGLPANTHYSQFVGTVNKGKGKLYVIPVTTGQSLKETPPGERWRHVKGLYSFDFDASTPLFKQSIRWQESFLEKPDKVQITLIAMPDNDTKTAYIAGADKQLEYPVVYKTLDGGKNWFSTLKARFNENVSTGWAGHDGDTDWWYGGIAEGLAVSPNNSQNVILTDMGFVHISNDGGEHWRQAYVRSADQNNAHKNTPRGKFYQSNGVEQTSSWWIDWPSEKDVFVSMTDITSQYSNDGGLSWTRNRNNGLNLNTTYHTLLHPRTKLLYGGTSSVHDLYQTVYMRDSLIDKGYGGIVVSNNNGKSWQSFYDFNNPVVWLTLDPNDDNTMYVSIADSKDGGVYVTNQLNDPQNLKWKRLATPPRTHGHPNTIRALKDGGLVVSYAGSMTEGWAFENATAGIFYSEDKGASWKDVSVPEMTYWMKDVVIDPNDSSQNTWYGAVFSAWGTPIHEAGGLYRTKNRGKNWKRIANLYRVESCTVNPNNPNHMYVTTENSGLWQTFNLNDENPKFEQVRSYPFKHPFRVLFNPHNPKETWVTSFGGGLFVLNPKAR